MAVWFLRARPMAGFPPTHIDLRWELYPIMTGMDRYDFTTNRMVLGGTHEQQTGAGSNASKLQFAPRFGFAYRVNDKTVIRGGYGISIDPYRPGPKHNSEKAVGRLHCRITSFGDGSMRRSNDQFLTALKLSSGISLIIDDYLLDGVFFFAVNAPEKGLY